MNNPKKPHLPIGYWLKKVDETLTAAINQAQENNGLTRIEWQILNSLYEVDQASQAMVTDVLRPFADAAVLEELLHGLSHRGLIEGEGSETNPYQLIQTGRAVHEAALSAQKAVRQQSIKGIEEADYVTAVRVLQTMVANLSDD